MPPNSFGTGFVASEEEGASIQVTAIGRCGYSLHYQPAPIALEIAGRAEGFVAPVLPILLAKGDTRAEKLVMHPLNTTATSPGFLLPKHGHLRTITLQGFSGIRDRELEGIREGLLGLPSTFIKDPLYGLGVKYELRALLEAIAEVGGVTDMRVVSGRSDGLPRVDGTSYVISRAMLDGVRKALVTLHSRALQQASAEKTALSFNRLVRPLDPSAYPRRVPAYRRDAVLAALGNAVERGVPLSETDEEAVVRAVRSSVPRVVKSNPSRLLELTREVEVVSLETLIEKMKARLVKKLSEAAWQTFFVENAFILRLAFGVPVMMVGGQLSMGGRRFDGGGDKIADFAVKALVTGNLTLIEIKTPDTALLETKTYRGSLYAPSREIAGATNQVLDQRYHLQQEIAQLKLNSRQWDIESYAVTGLVVAGRDLVEPNRQKSFELYRNALKSLTIVTFDELLAKLEGLLAFLREPVSNVPLTETTVEVGEPEGEMGEELPDDDTGDPTHRF